MYGRGVGVTMVLAMVVFVMGFIGCKCSTGPHGPEGPSSESLQVYDYEYVTKKFYLLGEQDTVIGLEVFREVKNPVEGNIEAQAWIDPANPDSFSDLAYLAYFEQLVQGNDYIFNPDNWIELIFLLREDQALAVYYATKSGEVGDLTSSPVKLKLIKPDYRIPWYVTPNSDTLVNPTWECKLKNFYYLGDENIIDTSISINIWKRIPGGSDTDIDPVLSEPYLQLLGLDMNADGRVDQQWIHNNKYLMFPSLKPFFYLPDGTRLPDPDSAIYYETNFGWVNPKYYIIIHYTSHTRMQ